MVTYIRFLNSSPVFGLSVWGNRRLGVAMQGPISEALEFVWVGFTKSSNAENKCDCRSHACIDNISRAHCDHRELSSCR